MADQIEAILSKFKSGRREDLIPLLQEIQEIEGMISEEAIVKVGNLLGMSTTKIYGLATFYEQFRFLPLGRIHLKVCHGTTCFLNGSQAIIKNIKDELDIEPGQTTRDGSFSYEIVSCMGGCNNSPVIYANGEFFTYIKPQQVPEFLRKLRLSAEDN